MVNILTKALLHKSLSVLPDFTPMSLFGCKTVNDRMRANKSISKDKH